MGFLLPLNTIQGAPTSGGVSFDGSTAIGFDLAVEKTLGVAFAGGTEITFYHDQESVEFAGATGIGFALRINDEPNVFPSVEFAGGTSIGFNLSKGASGGVSFDGGTSLAVSLAVERASDFGFTFFVDITGAAVTTALNRPSNTRRFTARLLANGVPVPIIRASLDAPDDKLGVELTAVLARPDVTLVSSTASIDFQLGVWAANAWAWSTMFTQGRMSGRGARYANQEGLPADSVEVTFADVVGDRWNRAPRVPTFLYDPQAVDAPTPDAVEQRLVFNRAGGSLTAVWTPVSSMRLSDVLDAAYVAGCGFSRVVTNIEDFPVEEVAFSMTGGYDAGVRPLLEPYEPIVFPVGNDLWIVTLDFPLPAGFSAREFAASLSLGIDDTLPTVEPINAMIVHLKDSATGEYWTERLETKTVPHGTFGTDEYTETDVERRVREYRNFDAPAVIVREDEVYLKTRTLDYQFNEIAMETRVAYFDSLNRPTGYRRDVSSLLPDLSTPDGARVLQPALEETQRISYGVHPLDAARDVQTMIETITRGLILTDNDNKYLGKPYRIPLHDAHKSGYADASADQTSAFGMLRTVTETLRVMGGQVARDRRVTNHVANVEEPPVTQVLPGDASFDRRRSSGKTRDILITTPGTEATSRRVAEFDGTGLPAQAAITLATKRLARLNSPPRAANIEMSYPDPMMRKGLDLTVRGRDDVLGTFIVRGWRLGVAMLDDGTIDATMSFTAKELKA